MEIRRKKRLEDLRGAREVHNRTWRVGFRGIVPGDVIESERRSTNEDDLESLREEIASEPGPFATAVENDTVIGFVRARYGDTSAFVEGVRGEIVDLTVDPAHWRDGVGSTLLDTAIDRLPPMIDDISTSVLADNDRGRTFLETNGLVAEETVEATVGSESFEHVIYRASLD